MLEQEQILSRHMKQVDVSKDGRVLTYDSFVAVFQCAAESAALPLLSLMLMLILMLPPPLPLLQRVLCVVCPPVLVKGELNLLSSAD